MVAVTLLDDAYIAVVLIDKFRIESVTNNAAKRWR